MLRTAQTDPDLASSAHVPRRRWQPSLVFPGFPFPHPSTCPTVRITLKDLSFPRGSTSVGSNFSSRLTSSNRLSKRQVSYERSKQGGAEQQRGAQLAYGQEQIAPLLAFRSLSTALLPSIRAPRRLSATSFSPIDGTITSNVESAEVRRRLGCAGWSSRQRRVWLILASEQFIASLRPPETALFSPRSSCSSSHGSLIVVQQSPFNSFR